MITEGKWEYRPNQYDDWGIVKDCSGRIVAHARYDLDETEESLNGHRRNKTDPAQANGQAIAALPDMIEALQWYADKGEYYKGQGNRARAALSKAISTEHREGE